VAEAVAATGADASFVVVPPKFAADAIMEAAVGGVRFIVCITEGSRPRTRPSSTTSSSGSIRHQAARSNCPGIISPVSATSDHLR